MRTPRVIPGFPHMWFKSKLREQIDKYMEAKKQRSLFHHIDSELLIMFTKVTKAKDIQHIVLEDLENYRVKVRESTNGMHFYLTAMKEFKFLLKFYDHPLAKRIHTDGSVDITEKCAIVRDMETVTKRKPGRPLNITAVKRAKDLHSKGLSFREISRVIKKDVSIVWKWCNKEQYNLDGLK